MIGESTLDVSPAGMGSQGWLKAAARYALAAAGPIALSAAHFLAAILFLKTMDPAGFGLFAFVLVAVPFWLGLSVALLGAPLATTRAGRETLAWTELPVLMKANLLFSATATFAVALLMAASGAPVPVAALLGLYGGLMCLRWFARWLAYATGQPLRAALSDIVYGASLVVGLVVFALLRRADLGAAALLLCASAAAGMAVFGWEVLARQLRAVHSASLAAYRPIWRDLTQWALLGVVTTELSSNAHAWLVTFASGPKSFALIAAGSLFLRPVSLCLSALPDRERPLMVEKLARGDRAGALRMVRDFRIASLAIWFATLALTAAALVWLPTLVLKADYDRGQIALVAALWAAIMAVRAWRTPDAVLLQADRQFRPLAGASLWSSGVSLILTAGLLFAFGPIASLGGVLIGDIVLSERVQRLVRPLRS